MGEKDLTDRLIEQAQGLFGSVLRYLDHRIGTWVESPIEQAFLLSFIAIMQAHGRHCILSDDRSDAQGFVLLNQGTTVIVPQCSIDDYRVDFLFVARRRSTGAAEEFIV